MSHAPIEPCRVSIRLPRPLGIGLVAAVLLVAGFASHIAITGYRQSLAIRHLRELGFEIRPDISHIGPIWFQRWVGTAYLEPFGRVQNLDLSGRNMGDEDLADVKRLHGLEWLALNRNAITDQGVKQLSEIRSLKALRMEDTRVTDAGLEHLAYLNRLEVLSLKRTRITGSGLKHLGALPLLRHLDLRGNSLDDAAVADLKKLKALKELRVDGTKLSPAAIAELERTLGIRVLQSLSRARL